VDRIGPLLEERGDLLFVVDAITALGVHDISMKRDRIDVLICASQKALMSPPGLASVSLSPRAIACLSSSASRSFYFSLRRELAAQMKGQTGFTPAISLVRAVDTALKGILSVPREARLKRQKRLQRMAREALREDGLTLFNRDEEAAWGITVAEAPAGVQAKAWIQDLKLKSGLWLAGGQGELEGKIFRLAHLGAIGPEDLLWAIETIEKSVAAHYPNAGRHAGLIRARKIMEAG
jgi:aspartate aminotransferase-like enzyme